jgi:hypothetical protein
MKKRVAWTILMAGLVALAMSVAGPVSSEAATWYVKPTGLDTNTCLSLLAPCKTIAGVIGKGTFADGDSMTVQGGVYSGDMSFTLTKSNVTIMGLGAYIDCAGGGPGTNPAPGGCVLQGDNNKFKGFTVTRGWVKSGSALGVTTACSASDISTGNTIQQVTFKASLFKADDPVYTGGTGLEIRDCNEGAVSYLNSFTADSLHAGWYAFLLIKNNYLKKGINGTKDWNLAPPTLSTTSFDAQTNAARAALVLCSEADDGGTLLATDGSVTGTSVPVTFAGANAFRNGALILGTYFGSYFCPPK